MDNPCQTLRDRLQISIQTLSELSEIITSSKNRLNLLNIRSETWRRYLNQSRVEFQ